MFEPYESVSEPGPRAFEMKMPYFANGFFGLKKVEVADRYEPYHEFIPILPVPSPPFHQIWLPSPRKLQAVRLSMVTPSALKTSMPLPLSPRFRFWSAGLGLQALPDLVPSTITLLRLRPRRWRLSFLLRTVSL